METFCQYCSVLLPSEEELLSHCNSESHQLTIMSDEGREWKFRAPARGVGSDQYTLCIQFTTTGKCRLGKQCCDAHGEQELLEWKERFDYRQLKLQKAKECSLQGRPYTEELLEKWLNAMNPNQIMTENLDSVDISFEPETSLTVAEKNCAREWTFRLSPKATLKHIALLYETHRNHFKISFVRSGSVSDIKDYPLGTHCQEWSNPDSGVFSDNSYTVKVCFLTSIYGTFRQGLVFDFGFEPVLIKKLCVDVVSVTDFERLQEAQKSTVSFTERWNEGEVMVVPFENRPHALGDQERGLLQRYPAPNAAKFALSQAVMEPTLTSSNYVSRQHELIYIEEMAQYELLSRYNVQAKLNLSSCYLLTPNSATTAKYAQNGELFANMALSSVLSEDSTSGRLVLTNCSTVLIASIATKKHPQRKVYEAVIEDKGKTMIYIRLSKKCVEDLKLKPDREFSAEVQFQLNRLPLCEMHFAIDRLYPPSLVFPDVTVQPQLWNTISNQMASKLDPLLNPKQQEAVLAITTPLVLRLPPVLLIGPFGTGKTFTLAQAVKMILNDPNSRILVCTHSNSAADIYIREYLHPLVSEGRYEATPLRIYYKHRWVQTVHPTVQQYCLVNLEGPERNFLVPTLKDVKSRRVVVTTLNTARYLVQLGLEKGFFTHILIDEAAQAMECEAIMPLSLANENTRIVLAGDHMQLSPEVYSDFAQQRNLHTSLLERLYDLYPEDFSCKVLLCENYRSHEAIIQYTSELFYDNHLRASGQQPRHKKYYPLTFFTAMGEDIQDCNSTAFHNYAEVNEIVERVIELKSNWPDTWGVQDESSIGVVTPYYDQVVRIRAELRKKKLHGVSVERVLNVQGKQFRVIFLSAVRTRQTCDSKSNLDHGFLSNARLLNTAITRAQSLVAVVGDPVSLCSVGKCRKLWEKFILTCHKETSLFGITWDSLRSQLDSMELKKNFILNPLAPEFIPGRQFHGGPPIPTQQIPPMLFLGPALLQAPPIFNCMGPPFSPAFGIQAAPPPLPPQRPFIPPQRKIPMGRIEGLVRNPPPEHLKEFENGIGRPMKRVEENMYTIMNKIPELNPNEHDDMKRNFIGGFEHMNGFASPNEINNALKFQQNNHMFHFEEKPKPVNLPKPEDMMKPSSEFGMNLLQHIQNNKQPAGASWVPWMSKPNPEPRNVFEDHAPKPPFHEMNGFLNERENRTRQAFDNIQPPNIPFMPLNKWPEPMQNSNSPEVPIMNTANIQASLIEKLMLLQRLLPAGMEVKSFLENDNQKKNFLQILQANDGQTVAKAIYSLLLGIKKDQELLEAHQNTHKKQGRFCPPIHNMHENNSPRNMHFNPFSRPVVENSHHQPPHPETNMFNSHEPLGVEVAAQPFSMSRMLPSEEPSPFSEPKMMLSHPQQQQLWNNCRPPLQEHIIPELLRMSLSNGLDASNHHPPQRMSNGDVGVNEALFVNNVARRMENEDVARRMWSAPPQPEHGGSLFSLPETDSQEGSYLSRLRSITSNVNTNGGEFPHFSKVVGTGPNPAQQAAPGPLSMSYPDIPDILSSQIVPNGVEPLSKVIRKPLQKSVENVVISTPNGSSPFTFDLGLTPGSGTGLRYSQMPSEAMTYAKILRSPQH